MNSLELRRRYPVFTYKSFSYQVGDNSMETSFVYEITPDHTFTHRITFENIEINSGNLDQIKPFVFNLGLVEIPSYWKATASPTISIEAGPLGEDQTPFWHKLLINGMGEYFYKNRIDFTSTDFLEIHNANINSEPFKTMTIATLDSIIVPVGGGKDSATTLEIFRQLMSVHCLTINPQQASLDIARIAGYLKPITVKRVIDPSLINLNEQGYLNGHIPFSASVAFIALLAAAVDRSKYVVMSNERSSNEGNVEYLGHQINHQYSKSLEFETDFNDYVRKHLTSDIRYFSFLRPFYELQIAKMFAGMGKYFDSFRSCNRGRETNSWCGQCPKCISVALTLLPWTNESTIVKIFGRNPLTDPANQQTIQEFQGLGQTKPFECVTTFEEAKICLEFIKNGMTDRVKEFLDRWETNPNMPEKFNAILKKQYEHA